MQKNLYIQTHKKILRCYKQQGRVALPCHNTDNTYEIYLSKIMLEKTQKKELEKLSGIGKSTAYTVELLESHC